MKKFLFISKYYIPFVGISMYFYLMIKKKQKLKEPHNTFICIVGGLMVGWLPFFILKFFT